MNKIKAVVYVKSYTNDKKEMKEQEKELKELCNRYDCEFVSIIKGGSEEDFGDVLFEVENDNEIGLVVIKNFDMISKDPKIQYQNYAYLDFFFHCDILTLDMGYDYDFEVKLLPLLKGGQKNNDK